MKNNILLIYYTVSVLSLIFFAIALIGAHDCVGGDGCLFWAMPGLIGMVGVIISFIIGSGMVLVDRNKFLKSTIFLAIMILLSICFLSIVYDFLKNINHTV